MFTRIGVSSTVPRIEPGPTSSPFFIVGLKWYFFFMSTGVVWMPLPMNAPDFAAISSSGLWMPSYILPITPGPKSTDNGCPVPTTGSPGFRPDVDSYTWMNATSPVSLMTSPISFDSPTSTVSYIFAEDMPSALTAGPLTHTMRPLAAIIPRLLL